ncbi:hypothetical protein KPL71_011979 [Citrus sinensis]|uniref:Uncharacterized protein n=1 Tax=Citrus sinensis TaxID=2711 RepID=A0ACB8L848_CITSI|nr:hypothetical protein KPL71_011979 [Citrus sinensis]
METVTEIMASLHKMFGQNTHFAREAALKRITDTKMEEGTRVRDHVLKMMDYLNEVKIYGVQIDDKTKINMVIESLPDTFKEFKVSYILNNKDMTLIELLHKLHAIEEFYHSRKLPEKGFSSRPKSKDKNKQERVEMRKLSIKRDGKPKEQEEEQQPADQHRIIPEQQSLLEPRHSGTVIRIMLSIAAVLDYEIWQMNVKTTFLNGYLEEDSYMQQPDGFIQKGQEHMLPKLITRSLPYGHFITRILKYFSVPIQEPSCRPSKSIGDEVVSSLGFEWRNGTCVKVTDNKRQDPPVIASAPGASASASSPPQPPTSEDVTLKQLMDEVRTLSVRQTEFQQQQLIHGQRLLFEFFTSMVEESVEGDHLENLSQRDISYAQISGCEFSLNVYGWWRNIVKFHEVGFERSRLKVREPKELIINKLLRSGWWVVVRGIVIPELQQLKLYFGPVVQSAQINESQFPIMSPYNLYKQKTSFTRSIRTLISTKRPIPKEYIQSSRLDQCALQASQSEQYVTMEIPSDLVANWKREGYTHLYLGGVRLILTLHGRKGLPVTARIALLDTRFKEYQHAVIGTVLTTLHAGSVLLTFYPNFNLSLEDPNLPTTLKVQIQLQGEEQTPTSKIVTLHHQIVYRLQNHALDLPTPYTTSDALMILADTDTIPTIIQIPKQIHKQDLLKLMPLEWLTNYEHFHQNSEPVQTTEATFARRPNGQVKLSFQTPDTKPVSDSPQLSYTVMITAVQTGQEKKLPIHGFSSEGYPVYPDKINGNFLWDVPEAHMCNPDCPCLDDTDIDEELEVMRKKKKKKKKSSYPPPSCKSFLPLPPPHPKPPAQPIRSCLMFSSHSYEESFPPLEKQTDTQTRVTSKPFIQSPVTASGQPEEPKQYEAVLNWQTKNANAQNYTLHQLGKKIDRVATQVSQTETKVDSISSRLDQMYLHLQDRISADLRRMINNHIWGPEFNKKEAEIRKLKAELSRIDAEKARPSLFTQPQPTPVSPPIFDTYAPFYTPSRPQQPVYNQFFGFSHLQLTPQPSSPKKSRSKVKISEPHSSDSSEPETNHSSSSSSCASSQASTDSESEYADITGVLMATETADPSASTSTPIVDDNPSDQTSQTDPVPPPVHEHSTKPSSASWFTFDDIPHHKWAARHQEFAAWIDLQGTKPNAQPQAVLREFMARSTGSLRDWLESLGEYRQLQFIESPIGTALNLIHEQFIGEKTASTEADRKEYHQMKCCSLKRHLLDAHYKRMSILFYKLNGFNEPSLKHVFIASLPPELQPDLQRQLTATNLSIADISLGKIFQMAMLSLDKICEQKEFFKDLMEDKKPFSEACKKPYLKIECKDEKKCVCPTTKKRHFRKHFHRKSSSKKPFWYFKKKDISQYRTKKSNHCFVCKKRGHFARNCPHKSAKAVRLIQHLQHSSLLFENEDVESNFSEQSAQDDQTAFLIAESSDSEDISVISTVQTVNHVSTIPRPSLKMSILPSKFHKPVPVIGFIDTGADTIMIDPSVLPSDCWEHHSKLFRAVNGETFKTTKKPIDTLRLYTLPETPSPYSHISQKLLEFCPENHSQFHHPSPLWKNEQFFIHLPFKLNEDINPTKASHPGMSPSDLLLAKQECSQLLQQGLIESTDSDWACQAFYVEKRSELVRGKKRLVIDYQPLNSFLKDDKFPLPKIQTLFVHLQGARIFSKFDLKAGFWQLGISPVDRHKTAFCIPDAHYQWTVMPFGLKVAPSLFQKAMTKIFSPILHHALVYIDDILLFSSDHESHQKLLLDFFHIMQAHGIMLSEKKSSIGNESIDFLGMVIKDGQYQPGPHIAIELLKFPDTHLNRKQIQQFLGIVNYVCDFIPKVAIHTSQLSRMLKKQCPPWGPAQTEAVKQLKMIAQSPPPLRIPTGGQRILQTDASDDYWSAILLEDINGVCHFCAHASGQFKDSEKNYHVTYKEILAVKYGIKKFEFHLISHKFLINMDNYDFTVQHIKGNQNLIPDFLTRPAINKPALISSIQTIPVIAMNRQLPFKALNQRNFPMNISFQSAYQLQDFAKKFLYRFFFNIHTKKPDRFPNLCMEHLFLTGLTLSSLSISEDELWYMWCLTTLYATKLVFPIRPVLTTPEFSPDLLWTLFEWYSPLTWWRKQLQHLCTFHGLDNMPEQEANMWTTDMAYEWRTYPHPYTLIHDTSVSSVLKAYLMELNNVPLPAINIHHTSIGPSHTLEVIPKTQGCTPGSSSSPQGIHVMEQRPDYTNVLFQDAQDPWEDFQSLLHTENPHYTVTTPASPVVSTSQPMTEADEAKYQQAEAYLDQRQRRRHKRQYEKATGDVSPSRYPSTP